jgi:hypothetical protein
MMWGCCTSRFSIAESAGAKLKGQASNPARSQHYRRESEVEEWMGIRLPFGA